MKRLDATSQAATDVVKKEQEEEEKRKKEVLESFKVGTIIGEAFAHGGYRILSTLNEWKRISEIQENKEYLKIPGISTFQGFLDWIGCPKVSAWRNMKIANYFDPQDVSNLERLRPSQQELLKYTKIPKDQLKKILNEDGDIEEIKEALVQATLDNKSLKDDRAAEKKTSERLLQAKQALIDRESKDRLTLEEENRDLRDKVNGRLPKVDWTDEEKEYNQILAACQMQFMEILATIRNKIPPDKVPPLIITQLRFLYVDMALSAQEERIKLNQFDDGSFPAVMEMDLDEDDIPPVETMIANMPLTAPTADAFNKWRERKLAAAKDRKGAKERED